MSFLRSRRKSRETIGITGAAALLVSPLVLATTAAPAAADDPAPEVVLSTDFEDASWEDVWLTSGDVEPEVVNDDGNQVVKIAGRVNDFDGIQTNPATVSFDHDVVYTFSAKVKVDESAGGAVEMRAVRKVSTGPETADYAWVGNTVVGTDWTEINGTFTLPVGADASTALVYFGTGDGAASAYTYYIDDVLITRPAAGPVTLLSSNFEDGEVSPWVARDEGNVELAVTEEGHESSRSLKVSGRESGWHGTAIEVDELFTAGTYTVTAWVKLPAGSEGTTGINLGVNQPGASNEYPWISSRETVGADEWVQLSGTYTVDPSFPPTVLYVEAESATAELLVDDVLVLGPAGGPPVVEFEQTFDFEDATLQGWTARATGEGAPTVDVTDAEAFEGTYAAIVTDRVHQGQGIGFDVSSIFEAGVTYDITAHLKFAEGEEPGNISLTLQSQTGTADPSFGTVGTFDTVSNSAWVEVTGALTMPTADSAYLYFETEWAQGEAGNTSSFLVDHVVFKSRVPSPIQDLTPLKDTVDFPMGIAIDSRETLGAPAELLLKHFNQVTPENHMKPEAFYSAPWEFQVHPQAIEIADFAQANGLRLYGHVLVWHSQTPDWFFQDEEGQWLTSSEEDKQEMRERMRTHIFKVAEAFADLYGPYGSPTNPFAAWDVINEVVDDGTAYEDGLRRSYWYQILGEEFIHLSFKYADEAFNQEFAAEGSDRPVKLFINDYNTEQYSKQDRYAALVDRLLANPEAPIDGVGHQFHVSLAQPTNTLEDAIKRFQDKGLVQAVTELDVTVLADTQAQIVEQGHYYKRAFDIFRTYADELEAVTVWGLNDGRSWRSSGKPLLFDDSLQAKPAYFGAAGGEDLPPIIRSANVFAADVTSATTPPGDGEWDKLRLLEVGTKAGFQARWSADQLTVYVEVEDTTAGADAIELQLGAQTVTFNRDGSGDVDGVVTETPSGYAAVIDLPLPTPATQGSTLELDVRVVDDGAKAGWNSEGQVGVLSLVEPLSYVEVPEIATAPTIDGEIDAAWATANPVTTAKRTEGSASGAKAEVRTLWKGQTLYVLMNVTDPVVDTSHSDPWGQDSVEIYVDAGNFKAGGFRYDDTQIRVNADNVVSFGTGDETFQRNRVVSATQRTATGWVAEVAIDLLTYSGLGTFHGLDFQVNDGAPSSARQAVHNWADPTGTGYQSTARWGVGKLVGPNEVEEPEEPAKVAPKITLQPKSVVGKLGKTVTLKAAASGTPKPIIQWQQRAKGASSWKTVKGASSTSLKVKVTKKGDGTSYRAVFTNAAGKATTKAAKVTVKPVKAKVTKHPKSAKKVKAGKKVRLTAKAKGAYPAAKVSWEQLKPGAKKWTKVKGAKKTSLIVVASHKTHGVKYRAVFTNKAGSVRTKAAKVTVRAGKPAFVAQPKNASVKAGKRASFTAEVAASPKARLQWYSKAPGSTTWVAVKGAKKSTLTVRSSSVRSGTTFTLIASNAKGWTASKVVRLTVKR